MEVYLLPKNDGKIRRCSVQELGELLGFEYCPTLVLKDQKVKEDLEKRCLKAGFPNGLAQKQKWLSAFHGEQVSKGQVHRDLAICWIERLNGYGVFARKDIPAGAYIGEYTGEVRKRRWVFKKANDYCFYYSAGNFKPAYLIDAEKKGNVTRLINHADNANLEPIPLFVGGLIHILLFSTKPIAKGQQLTYDYGDEYWLRRDDPSSLEFSVNPEQLHFEDKR